MPFFKNRIVTSRLWLVAVAAVVFYSCSKDDPSVPTETDPVVTSFSPTEGMEGTSVVITGSNFGATPEANLVKFAGTTAVVTAASSSSLTTTVPVGAVTGTISVTVDGKTATSSSEFSVIDELSITGFYPAGGSPGIPVTIIGTSFSTTASQNLVKVNGVNATVNAASATKLVIAIPASGSTGEIAVTVGSETVTSSEDFEYFLDATKATGTSVVICDDLITDAAGNIYVTGAFLGTATFASTNLTSDGSDDGFVAKYLPDLSLDWVRKFGSTSSDRGFDVAFDSEGNVYVVGVISGTATFGALTPVTPAGSDAFVARLNSSGTFEWVKSFGDYGSSIAVLGDVVYATGSFSGTNPFGSTSLISTGGTDIFLTKQNRFTGTVTNAYKFGGTSDDNGQAIALDGTGNIYIGGTFSGIATFGVTILGVIGMWDGFLIKLDATGPVLWAKQYGSLTEDAVYAVEIDASGNGYAAGYFTGSGNMAGTSVIGAGNSDAFVAKFPTSSGTPTFVKKAGGANYEEIRSIAINSTGTRIYLTGHLESATTFDSFSIPASPFYNRDVFLAVMDASGTFKWASSGGSTESDTAYGVGVDDQGYFYVGGNFRNNPGVFGGTSLSNTNGVDATFIWRSKLHVP